MKLFIGWSGDISKKMAIAFKDFIHDVLFPVEPWISTEIESGSLWGKEWFEQLGECKAGILFLTRENIIYDPSSYLMFEAGAIAKTAGLNTETDGARLYLVVSGLEKAEIKPPLSNFQYNTSGKSSILTLVKDINKRLGKLGEKNLKDETTVERHFNKYWADIEKIFKEAEAALKDIKPKSPKTVERKMLEEILLMLRGIIKTEEERRAFFQSPIRITTPIGGFQSYFNPEVLADIKYVVPPKGIKTKSEMEAEEMEHEIMKSEMEAEDAIEYEDMKAEAEADIMKTRKEPKKKESQKEPEKKPVKG